MLDSFVVNVTVFDEWESGGERFRLINQGAGPDKLQVFKNSEWVEEKECYKWGVLTSRVKELVKSNT